MRNNGNGFALCFHLVWIDFKLKVTDFHLEHLSKVWNRKSKRKEIVMLVSDNMSLSSTRTLLIGNRSGNSRRYTKQNATINSPVHISRFFEIHDEISPGIVDPVHRFYTISCLPVFIWFSITFCIIQHFGLYSFDIESVWSNELLFFIWKTWFNMIKHARKWISKNNAQMKRNLESIESI